MSNTFDSCATTTPTYEPGDKVRVVESSNFHGHYLKVGSEAEVTSVNPSGTLEVRGTHKTANVPLTQTVRPEDIEPITPEPTYQPGDRVKVVGNSNTPNHYLELDREAEVVGKGYNDRTVAVKGWSSFFSRESQQFVNLSDLEPVDVANPPIVKPTYKVGDKVRVIESNNTYGHYLEVGTEAEVVRVRDGSDIIEVRGTSKLTGKTSYQSVKSEDIEPITPEPEPIVDPDTRNLSFDNAVDLLVAAAVSKPEHVDPSAKSNGICQYVYDNGDRCIVGQVLSYSGISDDELASPDIRSVSSHEVLRQLEINVQAPRGNPTDGVLALAQTKQDRGERWIDAVRAALRNQLNRELKDDRATHPAQRLYPNEGRVARIDKLDAAIITLDTLADALGLDDNR